MLGEHTCLYLQSWRIINHFSCYSFQKIFIVDSHFTKSPYIVAQCLRSILVYISSLGVSSITFLATASNKDSFLIPTLLKAHTQLQNAWGAYLLVPPVCASSITFFAMVSNTFGIGNPYKMPKQNCLDFVKSIYFVYISIGTISRRYQNKQK